MVAVRMCNRFGKGERAPITQLSTELIDMIIMQMLLLNYPAGYARTAHLAACSERRETCDIESHVTPRMTADQIIKLAREQQHCTSQCQGECRQERILRFHDAMNDQKYTRGHHLAEHFTWRHMGDRNHSGHCPIGKVYEGNRL